MNAVDTPPACSGVVHSWTTLILIGWNWLLLSLVAAFFMAMKPWKEDSHKVAGRAVH